MGLNLNDINFADFTVDKQTEEDMVGEQVMQNRLADDLTNAIEGATTKVDSTGMIGLEEAVLAEAASTPDPDVWYGDVSTISAPTGAKVSPDSDEPNYLSKVMNGQLTMKDYENFINGATDRAMAFGQGASFGLSDDISAVAQNFYLLTDQSNALGKDERTWGERIDQFWNTQDFADNREKQKEEMERFKAENPGEALMWEIAGGLLMPGLGAVKTVDKLADGANILQKTAIYSGIGAVEGAAYGYGISDRSSSTSNPMLQNIAMFSAFGMVGGAASPVIFSGAKALFAATKRALASGRSMEGLHATVDEFQLAAARLRNENPDLSLDESIAIVAKTKGETQESLQDILTTTGRRIDDITPEQVTHYISKAFEDRKMARLAQQGPIRQRVGRAGSELGGLMDKLTGALATRIKNKDTAMWRRLNVHDFQVGKKTQDYMEEVEGFLVDWHKKAPKETVEEVDYLLNNGMWAEAREHVTAHGSREMIEGFDNMQPLLVKLGKEYQAQGANITDEMIHSGTYMPRALIDYDAFRESLGLEARTSLGKYMERKAGKDIDLLTERQKQRIMNDWLSDAQAPRGAAQGGGAHLKSRTVGYVSREMSRTQYQNSSKAMSRYIRKAIEDVEEHKFFDKKMGGGSTELDVESSIGKLMATGTVRAQDYDEVRSLLLTRFLAAKTGPGKFASLIKNIGLMTALANPKAAAIQLADLGHSAMVNGWANSAQGMLQAMSKNGARVKHIGMQDIISEEFNTVGKSVKAMNELLKISQFKRIDRWGKQTFINSAAKKAKNMLEKNMNSAGMLDETSELAFNKQWHQLFDTPESMRAFKKAVREEDFDSEEMQLAMFTELAGIQPISLSQMPQQYLDMENGRLAYTLKSFAIKQLDIMRRKIWNEFKNGNDKQAAINALAYFTIVGGSATMTNEMRQYVFSGGADPIGPAGGGKHDAVDWASYVSNEMLWNMLSANGLINKFNAGQLMKNGDVGQLIESGVMIPLGLVGGVLADGSALMRGEDIKFLESATVKAVPLVGGIVHDFAGGGNKAKRRENAGPR